MIHSKIQQQQAGDGVRRATAGGGGPPACHTFGEGEGEVQTPVTRVTHSSFSGASLTRAKTIVIWVGG